MALAPDNALFGSVLILNYDDLFACENRGSSRVHFCRQDELLDTSQVVAITENASRFNRYPPSERANCERHGWADMQLTSGTTAVWRRSRFMSVTGISDRLVSQTHSAHSAQVKDFKVFDDAGEQNPDHVFLP